MATKFQNGRQIPIIMIQFVSGHDGQKQIIWWKINIPVWLASINDTKTHNILLYPPYECTRGGGGILWYIRRSAATSASGDT